MCKTSHKESREVTFYLLTFTKDVKTLKKQDSFFYFNYVKYDYYIDVKLKNVP